MMAIHERGVACGLTLARLALEATSASDLGGWKVSTSWEAACSGSGNFAASSAKHRRFARRLRTAAASKASESACSACGGGGAQAGESERKAIGGMVKQRGSEKSVTKERYAKETTKGYGDRTAHQHQHRSFVRTLVRSFACSLAGLPTKQHSTARQ